MTINYKVFEVKGRLFISGGYYASAFSEAKKFPCKKRIDEINKRLMAKETEQSAKILDLVASNSKIRNTSCYIQSREINEQLKVFDKKTISKGFASLGLYAAYCMGLDSETQNGIICFHITGDLYAYILVKDGMISPGGDLVATKDLIKESVISLIKNHNRTTNVDNHITDVYLTSELVEIRDALTTQTNINIILLGYNEDRKVFLENSEGIFWSSERFIKRYFSKSSFKSTKKKTSKIVVIGLALSLMLAGYLGYSMYLDDGSSIIESAEPVKTNGLVSGLQLVKACFTNTDNIFKVNDIETKYGWYISSFKCTSKNLVIQFKPMKPLEIPTMGLDDLKQYLGESSGVSYKNNSFSINRKLNITDNYIYKGDSHELFNVLGEYAEGQSTVFSATSDGINTFTIKSMYSPVYLVNNRLINDLPLQSMEGKYDPNSGYYNWTISGRIK